ncbi:unnamed protein product, partial [Rotaria magnacalcarata]
SDESAKNVRTDSKSSKNNRSSAGSHPKLEDETKKQMEMRLLDSSIPSPEIKQPKKKVTMA